MRPIRERSAPVLARAEFAPKLGVAIIAHEVGSATLGDGEWRPLGSADPPGKRCPMEGSLTLTNWLRRAARLGAAVLLCGAAVARGGGVAGAEDPGPTVPDPAALGPPVVLFTHPAVPPASKPVHSIVAGTPARRPLPASVHPAPVAATPTSVHSGPAVGTPLIPPAPMPAKLSPPPDARASLPLATDLLPLSPPVGTPQPVDTAPATAKPETS